LVFAGEAFFSEAFLGEAFLTTLPACTFSAAAAASWALVESVALLGELLVTLRSGLSDLALGFLAGVAAFFLVLPLAGVPSARDFAMAASAVRCRWRRRRRRYGLWGNNCISAKDFSMRRRDEKGQEWKMRERGKHCCVGCMRAIKLLECGMHVCGLPGQTLTSCRLAKGVAGDKRVILLQGDFKYSGIKHYIALT
jgi:hypothetical protein